MMIIDGRDSSIDLNENEKFSKQKNIVKADSNIFR
jgi:hypothetical protein